MRNSAIVGVLSGSFNSAREVTMSIDMISALMAPHDRKPFPDNGRRSNDIIGNIQLTKRCPAKRLLHDVVSPTVSRPPSTRICSYPEDGN